MISDQWAINKLREKDVPLIVDTKGAEFAGRKDVWQNAQDREERNKANSDIGLKSAPAG